MQELNLRHAIRLALQEEMRRDPRVILLGEDVARAGGVFNVTEGLVDEFGEERVRDTPISEMGFVGAAVGLAITGYRPVVEIMFADFTAVCLDQIVNQAAKLRYMSGGQLSVPLVVRTTVGAGFRFAAQHSQSPESWFLNVPGLKVAVPSTPLDAYGLMKTAIRDNNPVIFLEHKALYTHVLGHVPEGELVPFGRAVIRRRGGDVTIVATHMMVDRALGAAEALGQEGIDVEVIDPRTLAPLDREAIVASVSKTGRLVIAEESTRTCGWGAEVAAIVAEEGIDYLEAPILRVCNEDLPIPFSPPLEDAVLPDQSRLVAAVREVMARS